MRRTTSLCDTPPLYATRHLSTQHRLFVYNPICLLPTSKEARVVLALEALEKDKNLSLQAAGKIYNVH